MSFHVFAVLLLTADVGSKTLGWRPRHLGRVGTKRWSRSKRPSKPRIRPHPMGRFSPRLATSVKIRCRWSPFRIRRCAPGVWIVWPARVRSRHFPLRGRGTPHPRALPIGRIVWMSKGRQREHEPCKARSSGNWYLSNVHTFLGVEALDFSRGRERLPPSMVPVRVYTLRANCNTQPRDFSLRAVTTEFSPT